MPRKGAVDGRIIERTIDTVRREQAAARMRVQGHTYRQIADALGFAGTSSAHKAVSRAIAEVPREAAEELLELEKARLDNLQRRADALVEKEYTLVQAGKVVVDPDTGARMIDDGPVLKAIQTALRIQESRRKLLGLDAPEALQVAGTVEFTINGVDLTDVV